MVGPLSPSKGSFGVTALAGSPAACKLMAAQRLLKIELAETVIPLCTVSNQDAPPEL